MHVYIPGMVVSIAFLCFAKSFKNCPTNVAHSVPPMNAVQNAMDSTELDGVQYPSINGYNNGTAQGGEIRDSVPTVGWESVFNGCALDIIVCDRRLFRWTVLSQNISAYNKSG